MLVTPPTACPLADALQAVADRLQPLAEHAGLPGFSFSTSRDYSQRRGWYTNYSLAARPLGSSWTDDKGIRTVGQTTLADAEADFLCQLRDYEEAAYERDPSRRGEQVCEMYQELGAYDYAA